MRIAREVKGRILLSCPIPPFRVVSMQQALPQFPRCRDRTVPFSNLVRRSNGLLVLGRDKPAYMENYADFVREAAVLFMAVAEGDAWAWDVRFRALCTE